MLRDQLIKILAWRLGDRTDVTERALAELDLVQETALEQNPWKPWFLEKELSGVTIAAGASSFPLPTDFLSEVEDAVVWLVEPVTGGRVECQKELPEDLKRFVPTSSKPYAYTVGGASVKLNTSVSSDMLVEWRYAAKDTLMSAANAETLWLKYAPDLVLAALGAELAGKHYQNTTLAGQFLSDVASAWDKLLRLDTTKREVNQVRIMGRTE